MRALDSLATMKSPFTRIVCWLVIVVLAALILNGCVSPKFQVSVPEEIPVGVKGEIKEEMILLDLNKVVVSFQIQNFQTKPGNASSPLGIWLELDCGESPITLDPLQVSLKSGTAPTLHAISYLGPAESWQSPRAVGRGCGPRRYELGWSFSKIDVSIWDIKHGNEIKGVKLIEKSIPVTFEGKKCFMFWYNTDPSPALPIAVSINGLNRSGEPVNVPEVHFHSGTVSKSMVVP